MDLRGKLQNEQLQMADSVKTLQVKLNEEKGEYCVCIPCSYLPYGCHFFFLGDRVPDKRQIEGPWTK